MKWNTIPDHAIPTTPHHTTPHHTTPHHTAPHHTTPPHTRLHTHRKGVRSKKLYEPGHTCQCIWSAFVYVQFRSVLVCSTSLLKAFLVFTMAKKRPLSETVQSDDEVWLHMWAFCATWLFRIIVYIILYIRYYILELWWATGPDVDWRRKKCGGVGGWSHPPATKDSSFVSAGAPWVSVAIFQIQAWSVIHEQQWKGRPLGDTRHCWTGLGRARVGEPGIFWNIKFGKCIFETPDAQFWFQPINHLKKHDLEISKNIINVFCENPGQYGSFWLSFPIHWNSKLPPNNEKLIFWCLVRPNRLELRKNIFLWIELWWRNVKNSIFQVH